MRSKKCTHRTSRRRTSGCYVGEDLQLQRKFCNAFRFRIPVPLTALAEVTPAGFENLLAGERKLSGDDEGAHVKHAWGVFIKLVMKYSFLKAAFLP